MGSEFENETVGIAIMVILHILLYFIILMAILLFVDLILISMGVEGGLRDVISPLIDRIDNLINKIKVMFSKEDNDKNKEKEETFYTGILSPKGNFVECDYFDAEVLCKSIAQEYTDEYLSYEEAMQLIIKKGYIWIREVSIEFRKKKITKKQYKWLIAMRFKLNDEQKRDANRIIFLYQEKHS